MMPAQIIEPVGAIVANDEAAVRCSIAQLDAGVFGGVIGGSRDAAVRLVVEVRAWLETAAPGQTIRYASGMTIPVWAKGPKLMRDMQAAGIVELYHDRPMRGTKHYMARRTKKPLAAMEAKPAPGRPARADDEQRLLDLLTEIAAAGRPCPSNADLAGRLELTDGLRASYLMRCLVTAGLIANEATIWMPGRIVTIVASGHATGVAQGVRRK